MNVMVSRKYHLLHWIAGTILFTACALGNVGMIAWCAALVTTWELGVILLSCVLIAAGLLITVWQMSRSGGRPGQRFQ